MKVSDVLCSTMIVQFDNTNNAEFCRINRDGIDSCEEITHADKIAAMPGFEWKEKDHMRLTIELVPRPCWYSNLRSKMTRATWDHLRSLVYATYNDRCGICHVSKHISGVTLHCHEIWQFDLGIRQQIIYKADEDTHRLRYGSDETPTYRA